MFSRIVRRYRKDSDFDREIAAIRKWNPFMYRAEAHAHMENRRIDRAVRAIVDSEKDYKKMWIYQ